MYKRDDRQIDKQTDRERKTNRQADKKEQDRGEETKRGREEWRRGRRGKGGGRVGTGDSETMQRQNHQETNHGRQLTLNKRLAVDGSDRGGSSALGPAADRTRQPRARVVGVARRAGRAGKEERRYGRVEKEGRSNGEVGKEERRNRGVRKEERRTEVKEKGG